MGRYDDENIYGSGRSRAKGSARGRSGSSARGSSSSRSSASSSRSGSSSSRSGTSSRSSSSRGGTSSRSSSSRSGASSRTRTSSARSSSAYEGSHYGSYGARRGGLRKHKKSGGGPTVLVGGTLLVAAVALILFLGKGIDGHSPGEGTESETETTMVPTTELQKEVTVDNIPITGMSRDEARAAILKNYPWDMKVSWQQETYEVTDLMAGKVDVLLDEIYIGKPKEKYSLDTSGLEEAAKAEAAAVAAKWDKLPKNGAISSYDRDTDKFLFTGAQQGQAVDQEKLTEDILAALKRKDFDVVIEATVNPVEPEFNEAAAREKYKTISTFITKTTSNSKRNTNIKLAAQAINGIVLQPGEEFSFNDRVGQRTEEKGYKGAGAYNNGEVVEEIGGGVCQVSSTLYNAVLKAGLKTTKRQSHTYEPSYVTPGTDATVSWNGPDYKFVNSSSSPIGIRASYADQTMAVSIYGIPVLEEGVTYSLKSTKLKDTGIPAPVYAEDPTLQPGEEKVKSNGSSGSQWETRLIIQKDGEVVSQDVDHTVTYKGHAPEVLRNTTGTVAPTESVPDESSLAPSESSTIAPEGAGDGFVQPPTTAPTTGASGNMGPGGAGQNPGNAVGEGPGGGSSPVDVPSGPAQQEPAAQPSVSQPSDSFIVPMPMN